jgi:hypothetical protein
MVHASRKKRLVREPRPSPIPEGARAHVLPPSRANPSRATPVVGNVSIESDLSSDIPVSEKEVEAVLRLLGDDIELVFAVHRLD